MGGLGDEKSNQLAIYCLTLLTNFLSWVSMLCVGNSTAISDNAKISANYCNPSNLSPILQVLYEISDLDPKFIFHSNLLF